jgi:hypothetical protein
MRKARWGAVGRIGKRLAALGIVMGVAAGTSGCLKKLLLDGQISATRKASVAINSTGDWDIAEGAAYAGIAQLEGLRYLAPDNDDALFMLTRTWTSVGFGFIEDHMEQAEDDQGTSSPEYDFQKRRGIAAYERAVWYGKQLLEHSHPGFEAATKNADTMRAYLKEFDDKDVDAENLFWVGYAWLGRTNLQKDKGAIVGQLFVGAAMLERSVELDETYNYGSAHTALGAYHARSPMAEVDEAKVHLEKAMQIAGDKLYLPKLQMAIRYDCLKGDKASYMKRLNEILAAGDGDPYQRLPNTIAKRRAKRYLSPERMLSTCGF